MVSNTAQLLDKILNKQKCISLTTYKKNGEGVSTPIWFARDNDDIYIMTDMKTWKAKRMKNNSKVTFVSCSYSGKVRKKFNDLRIHGNAEFLDGKEHDKAEQRIANKYKLLYRFSKREENIFLRITPTAILKEPDEEEACDD
ncbi:MAG: PPOX class F420-dependent oxidoreductase [Candidatus Heimdallarchaeaceae archaeon]